MENTSGFELDVLLYIYSGMSLHSCPGLLRHQESVSLLNYVDMVGRDVLEVSFHTTTNCLIYHSHIGV